MQRTLETLADAHVQTVISHGAHDYKRHWATSFVPQRRMYLFSQRPFAAAARLVRFGLQPLWQRFGALVPPSAASPALESNSRTSNNRT